MAETFSKTVGGILQKLRAVDRAARKSFIARGREIVRYGWAPDYGFEYQTLPANAFFKAKVAKTSQAIKVFGPYLYQQNPHRTYKVREDADPQMERRAELASKYANYSIGQYNFRANSRHSIDDALSWGAGVMWTDRHPQKPKIIASLWDSVRDLLLDGDATTYDEQKRMWRRRSLPRQIAMGMYPQFKDKFAKLPLTKSRNDEDGRLAWETTTNAEVSNLVCWWECWTTYPLSIYGNGSNIAELAKQEKIQLPTGPAKWLMADDGTYIGVTEWDVPLFLDSEWPATILGFFDDMDNIYPVSPLWDGIGFQRAMNWIVTLMMGKYRFTSRTALAIKSTNGQSLTNTDRDKLLIGNDIEAISIKVNGENLQLKDFVEQFNWSQEYLNYGMKFLELMEQQYEKATGLTELLTTGQGDTQSRSATDAQMRENRSMSRINDMTQQIVEWQNKIARKEALCARFLLGPQDIQPLLGDAAATDWGILMKPDEQTAQNLIQQFTQAGLPPELAMEEVQRILSQAVNYEKWAAETDYTIEADSIRRSDSTTLVDSYKEMANQLIPTLMQSPDPMDRALGFDMQAEYIKSMNGDAKLVKALKDRANAIRMMPPPMPGPPPGATQGPPSANV